MSSLVVAIGSLRNSIIHPFLIYNLAYFYKERFHQLSLPWNVLSTGKAKSTLSLSSPLPPVSSAPDNGEFYCAQVSL